MIAMQVYKEKVSDDQMKHDRDVGKQKVELAQMEGGHLKETLAETEQLYQRREGEMRNILGEASKSQQEVQVKTFHKSISTWNKWIGRSWRKGFGLSTWAMYEMQANSADNSLLGS